MRCCARCPAFVPHPRIAEHARALGFTAIATAGGDAGLDRRVARMVRFPLPHRVPLSAMAQPDIIVTAPLPPFLYEPLKPDYRCHDYYAASHKPGLLAAEGARIRGLVQGGGTVTPTSLLDELPKLEIISVFGVGYDGVPVDYCRKRGLKVTNTPDVLTDDVADVAVGLVLMTGRGFARPSASLRAGEWEKQGPELTTKLGGKNVGILGLGRIGKAIATAARARWACRSRTPAARRSRTFRYRFVPDLEGARRRVGLPRRRVPRRRGDEEPGQRGSARRARQEGHDRQHRARLDHRRAGARGGAAGGHDQGARASTCSSTSRTCRRRC